MKTKAIRVAPATYQKLLVNKAALMRKHGRIFTFDEVIETLLGAKSTNA